MPKTKKISKKKPSKTRKNNSRKGGYNYKTVFSQLLNKNKKIHVFYIDGLDCFKEGADFNHYLNFGQVNEDNFTYICESHTATAKTFIQNYLTVGKTSCALKPLNSTENKIMLEKIINQILEQADKNDEIYVYGWSFGGMIINRIVEILVKLYSQDTRLNKIHFSTVGSIYITKKDIGSIDLINYIAIGDVANTCTRFIKHKQYVSEQKLKEKYTEILLNENDDKKILYKKREGKPIIYDVCFDYKNIKTCTKQINRIPIARISSEWDIHFNYYNDLLYSLMRNRTNNIENINTGHKVEVEVDSDDEDENVSETSEENRELQSVFIPGSSKKL